MGSCDESGCEYAFYDFGTVSTGSRALKTITVFNFRTISQHYEVNRDPDTNPLDHSFYVKPYVSPEIEPGGSYTFELEYAPVVPFTISYDYFNISDAYGICCKFGVKGKSLGPLVEISTRELVLSCIGSKKEAEEKIKLSNDSVDIAKFQFDVDEIHCFEVSPRQGIIEPNSEIIARVKFRPPCPGVYSRYLFCLIQYQSPLMINLVGIYTYNEAFKLEKIPLRRFLHQEAIVGGYESYVGDIKNLVEHHPPIVLSNNWVDFGQTDVNGAQNLPQTICVTNYIKTGVILEWETDTFGTFLIEPAKARINGDESAIFEVFFRPNLPDKMYSRELIARIHWDEKTTHDSLTLQDIINDISVPLTIAVGLMGHTFMEVSYIPVPQYNMYSTNICMPPCVPPLSVYNTFNIEKIGPHPLMFKFIPPEDSHYVVKPMQGVIKNDFQIIVAGVCPNTKEENAYFERWTLQFNSSPQYEVSIDLSAYAEYPKIQINEDNSVAFPPTFPGTEQNGQICLKNFTRHFIWYRFTVTQPNNELRLIEDEGSIASNEITYITWQFVPQEEGFKTITVTCDTCALLDCWCPFGTFVETTISVHTESEYTGLVSFPTHFDCGVIDLKKTAEIKFHLFNFGMCKMYFTLNCISSSDVGGFKKEDINIQPSSGKIEPLSKLEISVRVCPSMLGSHTFAVAYGIVTNSKSLLNILKNKITVTTVQYECVMPTVQIVDINYIGGGPIINKIWLWKMLNINRMNKLLSQILPNESPSVHINVPHAVMGSEPLLVFFLLRNVTEVTASWHIRQMVKCSCVFREDHMTRRVFSHQCAHRNQIFVHPLSDELKSHDETVLMVKIKYIVSGQNETSYLLKMGYNRDITITFTVFSLPQNICTPSVFNTSLSLQSIYIGESSPFVQAFWLYNSACQPSFYHVDKKVLREYNRQNMYNVISCINPSGTISPETIHPILFQFAPKSLDTFEVNVPLCLGTQYYYNLNVKGDGVILYQNRLHQMTYQAPRSSVFDITDISIYLSMDHLLMGPFITHSQNECIIFIENRSLSVPVRYSWKQYILPDFLTCTVVPSDGNLQPGESQVCKLNVTSQFQPCLLTVQVACEFVNLNLYQKYEEARILFDEIKQRQEDVFTITEKGVFKPECSVVLSPLPKPLYRVLAVSCSVTSTLQEDNKLSLDEQLKLFPSAEAVGGLSSEDNEFIPDTVALNIMRHVIDTLIWDTMFNDRFMKAVQKIKSEDSLFYGQFIMDQKEERKLVAFHKHVIPRNIMAKIIRDIIFEVFLEEYNLN